MPYPFPNTPLETELVQKQRLGLQLYRCVMASRIFDKERAVLAHQLCDLQLSIRQLLRLPIPPH